MGLSSVSFASSPSSICWWTNSSPHYIFSLGLHWASGSPIPMHRWQCPMDAYQSSHMAHGPNFLLPSQKSVPHLRKWHHHSPQGSRQTLRVTFDSSHVFSVLQPGQLQVLLVLLRTSYIWLCQIFYIFTVSPVADAVVCPGTHSSSYWVLLQEFPSAKENTLAWGCGLSSGPHSVTGWF